MSAGAAIASTGRMYGGRKLSVCWGPSTGSPATHRAGCTKDHPLCRWNRPRPCTCPAFHFPHRAGSCASLTAKSSARQLAFGEYEGAEVASDNDPDCDYVAPNAGEVDAFFDALAILNAPAEPPASSPQAAPAVRWPSRPLVKVREQKAAPVLTEVRATRAIPGARYEVRSAGERISHGSFYAARALAKILGGTLWAIVADGTEARIAA